MHDLMNGLGWLSAGYLMGRIAGQNYQTWCERRRSYPYHRELIFNGTLGWMFPVTKGRS